jgi:hypothetical protein
MSWRNSQNSHGFEQLIALRFRFSVFSRLGVCKLLKLLLQQQLQQSVIVLPKVSPPVVTPRLANTWWAPLTMRLPILTTKFNASATKPSPAALALKHLAAKLKHQTWHLNPQFQQSGCVSRPSPQRYKGYIYATLRAHDVEGSEVWHEKSKPIGIEAGFEVAPGDASDIEVANAHRWGCKRLVFSDGLMARSANLNSYHSKSTRALF